MKDELEQLESRKTQLEEALAAAPAPAPVLHPAMADLYQRQVARLQEALNRPESRVEAAEALRQLIDEIRLVSENGKLEIDIVGDLAGILALGCKSKHPARVAGGVQLTLVAGTCNHRELTLCCPI